MIQPLQLNSQQSFMGATMSPMLKAMQNTQVPKQQAIETISKQQIPKETLEKTGTKEEKAPKEKEKFSIKKSYKKAKSSILNFFKGINTTIGVAKGIGKGALYGSIATAATAILGQAVSKNKETKGLKVISEIAKDSLKESGEIAKKGLNFVKRVFTKEKSLIDHAKELLAVPKRFYKKYKGIGAMASVVGAGVMAFHIIKNKIHTNEKNADIDHKFNNGHIK